MFRSFVSWPSIVRPFLLAAAFSTSQALPHASHAQSSQPAVTAENLRRARQMLEQVRKDLHEFYYDSTFRGIDVDARFRAADSALGHAPNNNYMWAIIAQVLDDLKDSHTRFYPPGHVARVDYGLGMRMVGDTCFVVSVKKESDAEKKGLKVGDAVIMVDGIRVTRGALSTINYVYGSLSPRPGMRLVLRGTDGTQREIIAMAKITQGERIVDLNNPSTISRLIEEYDRADRAPRHFYRAIGDTVLIWRMPSFAFSNQDGIDEMMNLAKKYRAVILDLRNNSGGAVSTQLYLTGGFFDREVHVATVRKRKELDSLIAKPTSKDPYRGMLVILVNSESASASELTSRIMQLEGRAIVVGDRTMGALVASTYHGHSVGFDRRVSYGASITVFDITMPDGGRIESVGVVPNQLVLPSGADLAAGRDPQMAKALEIVGLRRTPEEAGAVFRRKPEGDEKP